MNIARRFLFSKKSHSIVNLVARVSIFAIAVPVVALVLVLSLHNGLSDYVHDMYSQMDSDVQVVGKGVTFFEVDSVSLSELHRQVGLVSRVVQGNALVRYADRQAMVSIRGVDTLYDRVVGVGNTIVKGEWKLDFAGMPRAVLGAGVAYELGYGLTSNMPLQVYALRPTPIMFRHWPIPFYALDSIVGQGIFQLDKATDQSLVFVPFEFAQSLLGGGADRVSSLEIKLKDGISSEQGSGIVRQILGDDIVVLSGDEQRGSIYRVMNVEKWIITLMLVFVAFIAAISLAGCMLMMLSEKGDAIRELEVMGMTRSALRAIFERLGMMIVAIGVVFGVLVGLLLVALQDSFGILTMGGQSFMLSVYPVRILVSDIVVVVGSVATIGYIIIMITVRSIVKKQKKG